MRDTFYDDGPAVSLDSLILPYDYLYEDAYLGEIEARRLLKEIKKKERHLKELVHEILGLWSDVSKANAKTSESIEKVQLRQLMYKGAKKMKPEEILRFGKECYKARQAKNKRAQSQVKHFPEIKEVHQ